MAGNRAVAGRVGKIRDRALGVAALIALGRSGSLWEPLGRAAVACRCLWRSTGRQRRAPAPFFFMAPFGAVSIRAGRGATEWLWCPGWLHGPPETRSCASGPGIRHTSRPPALFLPPGAALSAVDLLGNWVVRGPQAPKTTQKTAVLHQSPDKRGVPLPVKMVSQLTQTWHSPEIWPLGDIAQTSVKCQQIVGHDTGFCC